MRSTVTILAALFALVASPAAAGERLADRAPTLAKPKEISTFSLGARRIDLMATTRGARADTPLSRAHLQESAAMAQVLPGYPQPAFVSVGFRVNF